MKPKKKGILLLTKKVLNGKSGIILSTLSSYHFYVED